MSAKLKFGDAIHYITLATLGKEDTIASDAIMKFVGDETEKKRLLNNLKSKFSQIKSAVEENPKSIVELTNIEDKQIEFLTSTRLLKILDTNKKKKQYTLTTLKDSFPGMKFSELRIFPGDFQSFSNLMKKYTFGEERSDETVKYLYDKLKNKPYIAVSYADDLNGSDTKAVYAKLIPISSSYRKLDKVIAEVNSLKEEASQRFEELLEIQHKSGLSKAEARQNVKVPDDVNAKTDCLLNGGQVLDILIK